MMKRKQVFIPAVIGLSLGLMALSSPKSRLVKKWQMVPDYAAQDSLFQDQLSRIDTLTAFPPDFLKMRDRLKDMSVQEREQIPALTIDLLKSPDLETFKRKARAVMQEDKMKQDEQAKNEVVIYDFQSNGVIKMYAANKREQADTSTIWKEDLKNNTIILSPHPSLKKTGAAKDPLVLKILYLSTDSLSLSVEGKAAMGGTKPVNFIKYKGTEKK